MASVNEEKLLNEMFVILEYSDTFKDFIAKLNVQTKREIIKALTEEGSLRE